MVDFARAGPNPDTEQSDSTVQDAIFSQELNPSALSASAVEGPMPGILMTGVGM